MKTLEIKHNGTLIATSQDFDIDVQSWRSDLTGHYDEIKVNKFEVAENSTYYKVLDCKFNSRSIQITAKDEKTTAKTSGRIKYISDNKMTIQLSGEVEFNTKIDFSEKPYKLGDRITVTEKLVRESAQHDHIAFKKFWNPVSIKKQTVMIIGIRTLQNGKAGYHDWYFLPDLYFKALLVVSGLHKKPFYVIYRDDYERI